MVSYLTIVLVLTVTVNVVVPQQDLYCHHPVDIAILLDSSSSFGRKNFEELKSFAKNFLGYLKLADHRLGPHVAFLTYGSKISPKRDMINFRYSSSVRRLSSVIDTRLSYDGGKDSRLDYALNGARTILFQRNMGYRTWVPHVVVAITGTWHTWSRVVKSRIQYEARLLRERGFQLMIATIGDLSSKDKRMFQSLVGSSDENMFMVKYAFGLVQVAKKMVQRLCPVPRTHPCPGIVDIAFIVDSSGSISHANYRKIKYFVYSIANALNVSVDGAHAGVVIYSTKAKMVIKFTDHTNIRSFQKAVYGLKHMRQYTRIDLGLTIARSFLFSPIYGGARPSVKKLAFILTDGKQNPNEKGVNVSVAAAAKPLMDQNIKTFSIGIGNEVNRNELRAMVQYDEDVILAANFDELLQKIQNISEQTCEEIIYSKCNYPADIAFVLDSSTDISEAEFALQKSFLRTMAKLFRIFHHGSRGAVIVFGDQADVSMTMDENKEYRDFIDAVNRLSRVGGRRRTYKALELAEEVVTDYSGGARRKVPKVVLLLTAGPESDPRDLARLKKVSRRLHDRNVLVLVIGIGPTLITAELTFMVQNSVNLFLAKSFSELKTQLVPLSAKTCKEVGPGVCNRPLDLAFILDSSGSLTEQDFDEAKFFVQKLARTFPISLDKTRIALMIYSDEAHIISKFSEITSAGDLNAKMDNVPHLKGKTRIDLALKMAGSQVFTKAGGMRDSVAKVAIVITDGRQSPAPDGIRLDEAAAILLYHNVKVLSVGIGDNIDGEELNMMVEDPTRHTFWAESYSALRVQLATIARESCSSKIYTGQK